jgi:hypothetical protein
MHSDGNYHCGKARNGVCYYECNGEEHKADNCWYIQIEKIDGKTID